MLDPSIPYTRPPGVSGAPIGVLVALWYAKRPVERRHGVFYIRADLVYPLEQEWRLERVAGSMTDLVRGVYVVTGRAA